jgi:hypothetical protein
MKGLPEKSGRTHIPKRIFGHGVKIKLAFGREIASTRAEKPIEEI